jgi:cleavage and polyadenylation specificity factor subunit 1
VVGFAGHPRLSVVQLALPEDEDQRQQPILRADCLLDFSLALKDACHGAVSPLEQDMVASCCCSASSAMTRSGTATVACVLGGGAAVAAIQLDYRRTARGWIAHEPFLLPLELLSSHVPNRHLRSSASASSHAAAAAMSSTALGQPLSTGFGDIVSCAFVPGYLEPVLVMLHTDPGGRTFPGRLGRSVDGGGDERSGGAAGGAPPMYATAVSVGVAHRRAAVLWSCVVTGDSQFVTGFRTSTRCLVVGVNTICILQGGRVHQVVAVNGWARTTCPASLQSTLACNPMIKLSVSLDGCAFTWVSPHSALVSLRTGQLYVFQQTVDHKWTLLPLGQSLGGVGEIETLTCLPSLKEELTSSWMASIVGNKMIGKHLSLGFIFAGSRFGNSLLLGYSLESVTLQLSEDDDADSLLKKPDVHASLDMGGDSDQEYDRILKLEEEALYAPTATSDDDTHQPHVVPASDEETDEEDILRLHAKRQRLLRFTMIKSLTPLDSIMNLGPLGPSCVGPIGTVPSFIREAMEESSAKLPGYEPDPVVGSPAFIFPAGFGSSGGVALATVPGRDDRMILTEEDCLNIETTFLLPHNCVVLLCVSPKSTGGTRVLSVRKVNAALEFEIGELSIDDWCSPSGLAVFNDTILQVGEFSDGCVLVLSRSESQGDYVCTVLRQISGKLEEAGRSIIKSAEGALIQVTPFVQGYSDATPQLSFICLWSNGEAQLCSVSSISEYSSTLINERSEDRGGTNPMEIDEDDDGIAQYYHDERIVSVDLFKAPSRMFGTGAPSRQVSTKERNVNEDGMECSTYPYFDEEDNQLYCVSPSPLDVSAPDGFTTKDGDDHDVLFVALCRQSGKLEVFHVSKDSVDRQWTAAGCGQGAMVLTDSTGSEGIRPRFHKVSVHEMRFFCCGPSQPLKSVDRRQLNFCIALEYSNGDFDLYSSPYQGKGKTSFFKVPLRHVARPSQEQGRHRAKLLRKGMVKKQDPERTREFSINRLHRFSGISGQDGLFHAGSRPLWVVSERGEPRILFHRTRYAAPAGCKERPVSGFCSGLTVPSTSDTGFLVLHERVGKIGSQRLTAFRGLSKVFASQGVLGGLSGMCIEKVSLGVTVHQIEFINESTALSDDHPLYVMLVSREMDVDQVTLNSDGLSPEERQEKLAEKEAAKIRKQVEADLGGFDMESEWVEEIERENCFSVDTSLGGAPPLRDKVYSLWIVDAANNWMVVDSFELDPQEHGLTMTLMNLSDFKGEAGSTSTEDQDVELSAQLFVAVGTGLVDHNGEDVASRGRVLLFQIEMPDASKRIPSRVVAELSLVYEKQIFHGPVTTLSCLSSEGKNRLVIGAGADVNIEQWGNSKLTQVGFFRATMQILDILIFKNFLLLSDAYDSVYFLVWRDSDKSLTLLAKDYDPIPVHAAGLISRGASMTFLCHDDRQNLQFFQYAPGEAAARGGNKLVCRADFHLGTQTTAFRSHFCRSSLAVHSATPTSTLAALRQQDANFGRSDEDQRILALFGSTDGGLGAVVPISEPVYWRLLALQSVMANALDSDCGLSFRAWRLYRRTTRRGGCRSNDRKKGVIDGDLVFSYTFLPKSLQEDLASAIGSTVDLILDNLLEIQSGGMIL